MKAKKIESKAVSEARLRKDHQTFFEAHAHEMEDAGPEYIAKAVARNAALKDAKEGRINMRVNARDLLLFKQLADRKGIGYQTLLSQIIHQYSTGTLVDVDEVRKMFPDIKKKAL